MNLKGRQWEGRGQGRQSVWVFVCAGLSFNGRSRRFQCNRAYVGSVKANSKYYTRLSFRRGLDYESEKSFRLPEQSRVRTIPWKFMYI